MSRERGRPRLSTGLLFAQLAVLVVAAVVAAVTAALVGPPLFHEHMVRAGADPSSSTLAHVEEAFRSAGLITLATAGGAAVLAAAVVAWVLGRRLARPLTSMATAAGEIADGRRDVRLDEPSTPAEIATVTTAFNRMADDLEQTEQVRRRLLSDLAHELRTPLATMTAYLDGLEDGVEPDASTAGVLREQVERLTRLTHDLRAVSQADESALVLDRESIDVTALLAASVEPVRTRLAGSAVSLRSDVAPGLVVTGDRLRLQQVMTNLLDNAVRHTSAGSITVRAAARDDAVEIVVSDTGEGIAGEHLAYVFDRFFRADTARDRDHGGSGLGLAICRALVHAHGGTITVASDGPGTGATFTVRLPRA